MKLFIEATVIGIATVLIGTIVGYILGTYFPNNLPEICSTWNKNHIMEISLFGTGFFLQILSYYVGLNKWSSKNKK